MKIMRFKSNNCQSFVRQYNEGLYFNQIEPPPYTCT